MHKRQEESAYSTRASVLGWGMPKNKLATDESSTAKKKRTIRFKARAIVAGDWKDKHGETPCRTPLLWSQNTEWRSRVVQAGAMVRDVRTGTVTKTSTAHTIHSLHVPSPPGSPKSVIYQGSLLHHPKPAPRNPPVNLFTMKSYVGIVR